MHPRILETAETQEEFKGFYENLIKEAERYRSDAARAVDVRRQTKGQVNYKIRNEEIPREQMSVIIADLLHHFPNWETELIRSLREKDAKKVLSVIIMTERFLKKLPGAVLPPRPDALKLLEKACA